MPLEKLPGHNSNDIYYTRVTQEGVRPYIQPNPYQLTHAQTNVPTLLRDRATLKKGAKYTNINANLLHKNACYKNSHSNILYTNFVNGVHNNALSRLNDQLVMASNMFEDWYERKQSYELIGKTAMKLLEFATNYRKPAYWKSICGDLKQPTRLPEAWITYQFGIKPMMGSIDTAFNNLAKPLVGGPFYGSSRGVFTGDFIQKTSSQFFTTEYSEQLGCWATPNPNPNVGLLNIGGLTTPLSTAFSVIPWGWAIDYFVNASQLISNMEMVHPGVTVSRQYTTVRIKTTFHGFDGPVDNPYFHYNGEGYDLSRRKGVAGYRPELKFPLLGSNKFANLFSALALTMKGKSK